MEGIVLSVIGGIKNHSGSSIYIKLGEKSILLDCGYNFRNTPVFPDIKILNLFLDGIWDLCYTYISHAHLDHYGGLTKLLDEKFNGKLITSTTTSTLLNYYMSTKYYSDKNLKYNKIRELKDTIGSFINEIPLFIEELLDENIKIKLLPVEHTIGSTVLEIDYNGIIITYTGDINNNINFKSFNKPDILIFDATLFHKTENIDNSVNIHKLKEFLIDNFKKQHIVFPVSSLGHIQYIFKIIEELFYIEYESIDVHLYGVHYDIYQILKNNLPEIINYNKGGISKNGIIFCSFNNLSEIKRKLKNFVVVYVEGVNKKLDRNEISLPFYLHITRDEIFRMINELKPKYAIPIYNSDYGNKKIVEKLWNDQFECKLLYLDIGEIWRYNK